MTLDLQMTFTQAAPVQVGIQLPPGNYIQGLHDFELAQYGYKPRPLSADWTGATDQGYPEILPLAPRNGVRLTAPL